MALKTFFLLILSMLGTQVLQAANIDLILEQTSQDEYVKVTVSNQSAIAVPLQEIRLELDNKIYRQQLQKKLVPGTSHTAIFTVRLPDLPGSYIQKSTVFYLNNYTRLSLSNMGYFHFMEPRTLNDDIDLEPMQLLKQGKLHFNLPNAKEWVLHLPPELRHISTQSSNHQKTFELAAKYTGFNNHYPIFATKEQARDGYHYALIVHGQLHVDSRASINQRGYLSGGWLLIAVLLSLATFTYYSRIPHTRHKHYQVALGKYAARMFWVSLGYLLLKYGNTGAFSLADMVADIAPLRDSFTHLANHLQSSHYSYFFTWVIDAYWLFCLFACFPYAYYRDKDKPLQQDKYAAALNRVAMPHKPWAHQPDKKAPSYQKRLSPARLGFLTMAVKLFFLPYLCSWLINNIIHQTNLTRQLDWTFAEINAYILALFILTDTAIFAFGYLFEGKEMNNRMRSVEPTLLGWVVCLWCYPPFNSVSFSIFDHKWFDIHIALPEWGQMLALASVTACWGIFVWASLALGFKASNLTNRGIVNHGPYRYCRHPAYTIKVLAWCIEGVFLGTYFVGLLFGFMLIYFLRAWTEERHLSLDPDYLAYKKQVPYRFVPGVI
jgi:protein-S-isoprenylcysteine O-methyltransferase Ste14